MQNNKIITALHLLAVASMTAMHARALWAVFQ